MGTPSMPPGPVQSGTPSPRWWHSTAFDVHFDPAARSGRDGDVLVGIGDPVGADQGGWVVLNHKTAAPPVDQPAWACLSDHVARAPEAQVDQWKTALPAGMASVRRLVVEDASLDTCLALLLFACRVSPAASALPALLGGALGQGDGHQRRLASWLAYALDWEQGRYTDGDDIRRSAACQMAALAHSLFASAPDHDGRPGDADASQALRACLSLLDGYLARNDLARDAQPPRELSEFAQADAQLAFEQQQYLLALKHGLLMQLRLPLKGSSRTLLVDALIVTDLSFSGVLKVLARTDSQRSWTRRGFTLLGIHRPVLAGTGNDMTLSVDPAAGVSLQPLWQALERAEDAAWSGQRPCAHPRPGIAGYTDPATGRASAGAPDQPWYDELGRYTLLGAPKRLDDGRPGTRLDWTADVLPLLWRAHAPFDVAAAAVTMVRAPGRRVALVRWPRGEKGATGRSPVLHRWLAACSAPGPARHPGEFPADRDLTIVSLAGGDLVAHPLGVTLFDDWTHSELDLPGLQRIAVELAELADTYRGLLSGPELVSLMAAEQRVLAQAERVGLRRATALRGRVLAMKARLSALAAREATLPPARGAAELQQALEAAWGLPEARHRLWEAVTHLDEVLTQAQAVMQERRQFFSTAVISLAGLFFVLRDGMAVVANVLTMNEFERLLPSAIKLQVDPQAIAALRQSSELSDRFDLATLVAMVVVFAGGLVLALWRYFGARVGDDQP